MNMKIIAAFVFLTCCSTQYDTAAPVDVNNYLILTENDYDKIICTYRNGAMIQIENNDICPVSL